MTTTKTRPPPIVTNRKVDLKPAAPLTPLNLWLIGTSPLICHNWSAKMRRQMLDKQTKTATPDREPRDPRQEYLDSLYPMGDDAYGFPAMAVKSAIVSAAHKDRGIPKTSLTTGLFIKARPYPVATARPDAVCSIPLLRVWGSEPRMREDMIRTGGISKGADHRYRGEFETWAMLLEGSLNETKVPLESLLFLIREAGETCGIGEWRVECSGDFGRFRLAEGDETNAWDAFAGGRGPLPTTEE